MITKNSYLDIIDNTGILDVKCIGIFPSTKKSAGSLSVVKAVVRSVLPTSKFKKGMLVDALILATKYPHTRKNGRSIRVYGNLAIVLKEKLVPRGSRLRGLGIQEVRHSKYGRLAILLHRKL
jgi:large subunit ribosomal protein L14